MTGARTDGPCLTSNPERDLTLNQKLPTRMSGAFTSVAYETSPKHLGIQPWPLKRREKLFCRNAMEGQMSKEKR